MNELLKISILISFATTLAFIIHAAPNWRFPRVRLLLIVLSIYFLWNLWVLSTMLVSVFELKVFFTKIRQVFNPFLSPLWWSIVQKVFYPDFSRRYRHLLLTFYIIPVVSSTLALLSLFNVDGAERLMAFGFSGPDLESGLLHYQAGPWLKLQFLYAGVLLLMLTTTYLINLFNKDPLKVKYAWTFMGATIFLVPLEMFVSATPSSIDNQLAAGGSWIFIAFIFLGMSKFEFMNIRLSALRKILDEIPGPVLVWNPSGVLWEANEAASKLFRFRHEDLGEKEFLNEVRQKLDASEVFEVEGREFDVHKKDIFSSANRYWGRAYVLTDISEVNEINRTLKAVNSNVLGMNRDIHRVQKTLAHDLAHVVQQIQTQIVAHVPEGSGRETLQVSSDSAAEILSSTLSWIKTPGTVIDSVDLLNKALRQLQYGLQGREVTVRMPSEKVFVRGEEFLLATVFRNLISNAMKHSPEGRPIDIQLSCELPNQVVFRCKDNGPGFSANSPSGMGLSLVQEALNDLGATMKVHSSAQGSLIEVFFTQAKESGS